MIFKKLMGYIEEDSSFIKIEIEGGDNNNSIGDQIWISPNGVTMEILEDADKDVLNETKELFTGNSKRAFVGAMMRMGVDIDNCY